MFEAATIPGNRKAYSVKDAAAQISVSVPYIRNEVRDGNLKAKKVGRRVLILDADLQDYLEKQGDYK